MICLYYGRDIQHIQNDIYDMIQYYAVVSIICICIYAIQPSQHYVIISYVYLGFSAWSSHVQHVRY